MNKIKEVESLDNDLDSNYNDNINPNFNDPEKASSSPVAYGRLRTS